jgi:hypothetical protein
MKKTLWFRIAVIRIAIVAITAVTGFALAACDDGGDDDPIYTRWLGDNGTVEAWVSEEWGVAFRFYLFDNKYNTVQTYNLIIPGNYIDGYVYYYEKDGNQIEIYDWCPWNYRDDPFHPPYHQVGSETCSVSGNTMTMTGMGEHGMRTLNLTKKVITVAGYNGGKLTIPSSGVTTLADGQWTEGSISSESPGKWYKFDLEEAEYYYDEEHGKYYSDSTGYYLWLNDANTNPTGGKTAKTDVYVAYYEDRYQVLDFTSCVIERAGEGSYGGGGDGWENPLYFVSNETASTVYIYVRRSDDGGNFGTFSIAFNTFKGGGILERP